jgi:hypothetical protein
MKKLTYKEVDDFCKEHEYKELQTNKSINMKTKITLEIHPLTWHIIHDKKVVDAKEQGKYTSSSWLCFTIKVSKTKKAS